nr:hypothetical protein [Ruminococcus sp.]
MKTHARKLFSVMLSLIMTLMCMTTASTYADYQVIPEPLKTNSTKMTIVTDSITVAPGQDAELNIKVKNKVAVQEINNLRIEIPSGFTVTGISETSPAFNGSVTPYISSDFINFSVSSNGTLGSSDIMATIYMHVSESCTEKVYPFEWKTTAMSCTTADGYGYTPMFAYGIITVSSLAQPSTTQTTVPTTTTTQTTTTPTTTPTTTTTTVSTSLGIAIDSYPTKTAYTVGEELDLSGGKFHLEGVDSEGRH